LLFFVSEASTFALGDGARQIFRPNSAMRITSLRRMLSLRSEPAERDTTVTVRLKADTT
jgi:hypothetical protein